MFDQCRTLNPDCFVIAGENLVGAAKLACLSASKSILRSGAGLCKLLIHNSQKNFYSSFS